MNPIRRALEGWTADKWTKGAYHNLETGGQCLVGRLLVCNSAQPENLQLIEGVVAEQYGHTGDITIWNDAPERTFPEVVAVMEKAAVRYDENRDLEPSRAL